MEYLLGYDIGTSSVRGMLIDSSGAILTCACQEYDLYSPKPGWAEQDPSVWWDSTIKVTNEILLESKINPGDIAGIGLSGQQHSSVFLDKCNEVIRPAILWCDQRTDRECQEIHEIFGREEFIKLAFNDALPGYTAPKILWLRKNEKENFKNVCKVLLPKDYIRFKLSGCFATDVSDASGTLLMDIKKRIWSDQIITGLGLNKNLLPEVFESNIITSNVSKEAASITGLRYGTPIIAGAGDQSAGAIGCGLIDEGFVSDCLGTSGVVSSISNKPVFDKEGRIHTFCFAIADKWYLLGVTLSAGGSLKWYRENFSIQPSLKKKNPGLSDYALMDIQAGKINPGCDGLIFLPYLLGERAPYADPFARGTFFGISYMHRQDHFSRAIMEGVAFSQYDCFNLIKKMGIDAKEIIVFGGGSKSDVWRQIIADVFNRKVVLLNIKEMPSYGAALLAGHGVGIFESLESVIKNNIKEISFQEPDLDRNKTYKKFYKIYQSLYKSLKKDFKKLRDINI